MKLVTVLLCFAVLVLSTATEFCSEDVLSECVSLKKCPSVWNKINELQDPDTQNKLLRVFLHYVSYNYYCDCYANEKEPAIECPDELPEGIARLTVEKRKNKKIVSKAQKKKELLDECGKEYTNRMLIIGNRTDLTDYPWLALLQFEHTLTGERKFLCGGALISDRHVLTAAHCVTSPSNKLISVRLGEHDTSTKSDCISDGNGDKICKDAAKDAEVAKYFVHEGYNDGLSPRFGDSEELSDLAIIELKTKVKFSDDVRPICLPERPELPRQRYEVAGWSTTMASYGRSFPQKLRSAIYGISSETCQLYPINRDYSSTDHICAGGTSGKACIADAGGPLMAQERKGDGLPRMTVFGVGFMELPCSNVVSAMPGLFTKVHKYVPWIEDHIYSSD